MATTVAHFRIYAASGFMARLLGWHVFTHRTQGLYFARCKAVHGFGLPQPLAVRFVDAQGHAIGDWQCLRPWGVVIQPKAYGVLEMAWSDPAKRHQAWVAFQQASFRFTPWRWPDFDQTHCDK